MKKEKAKEYIMGKLDEGDSLIGFFQAMKPPNYWLVFLLGPIFFLSMRVYFVAVTEKGIFFHQLGMLGNFKTHDFFEFAEIESVKIGEGVLQRPMKFVFKNSRKLKLKAQLKGVESVAKLVPDVQKHIIRHIPLAE